MPLSKRGFIRHPRVGGDPVPLYNNWVPAYAGTTKPNKSAFPLGYKIFLLCACR